LPGNEFEQRRQVIAGGLADRKLDALVISFGPNLRYLTGFTGSNGMLLLLAGDAVFFTDPRYAIQAAREVSCRIEVCRGPLIPELASAARKLRIRRLGFEPGHISFEAFEELRAKLPPKTSLERVAGWVETCRMRKSAVELELIRCAVRTNSEAFEQALTRVRPGIREQDLAAELEYRMRRLGAEKPAFETIVAGGERSALPHARPTPARLRAGELVVIDMGAMQNGYASDMTRMLFLGAPGSKVKRMYRAVLEAQQAALDAVRAGVTAGFVDREARRVLKTEKLDGLFTHSTGHGLGLEIHEPPRLGRHERTRLAPGMAVTIEPGVYLEGFGGIRIEDTVVVTKNGCEILTPTRKDLHVV
jgi:Xaa-Pro aminopeptidase